MSPGFFPVVSFYLNKDWGNGLYLVQPTESFPTSSFVYRFSLILLNSSKNKFHDKSFNTHILLVYTTVLRPRPLPPRGHGGCPDFPAPLVHQGLWDPVSPEDLSKWSILETFVSVGCRWKVLPLTSLKRKGDEKTVPTTNRFESTFGLLFTWVPTKDETGLNTQCLFKPRITSHLNLPESSLSLQRKFFSSVDLLFQLRS